MGVLKQEIMQKIEDYMDMLQHMLENQQHISDTRDVLDAIDTLNKYRSIMSDEDLDYLEFAINVTETQEEYECA